MSPPFGGAHRTEFASSDLLAAQYLLQSSFRLTNCAAMVEKIGLPAWLSGLSVDGWIQVFYAFGLLRNEWAALCPKELWQCLAPADAQQVVNRGFRRLQGFGCTPTARAKNWSAVVASVPLVNLMGCPTGPQDQAIGRQLFLQIFGHRELDIVARRYAHMGQLDLFGESVA